MEYSRWPFVYCGCDSIYDVMIAAIVFLFFNIISRSNSAKLGSCSHKTNSAINVFHFAFAPPALDQCFFDCAQVIEQFEVIDWLAHSSASRASRSFPRTSSIVVFGLSLNAAISVHAQVSQLF